MTSPDSRDPNLSRASDADRERTAEILREAAADGRLALEEFQARLDAAFAARTVNDLNALLLGLADPLGARVEEVLDLEAEDGVICAGRWLVPPRMKIWTEGNILLDFTDAVIRHGALRVDIEQGDTWGLATVTFIVKPGITVDIDEVRYQGDHVRVSRQAHPGRPGILRVTVTGEVANDIRITTRRREVAATWARRFRRIVS